MPQLTLIAKNIFSHQNPRRYRRYFMPSAFSPPSPSPLCHDDVDDGAGVCIIEDARLGWTANLRSTASASGLPRARRRRRWLQPSAAVLPPTSCRPPPPRRRQNYSCVGVILVVEGVSVVVGIVASSSSSLAALRRPLVLSLRQLVVACNLCRLIVLHCPLVLRRPLVLLSHRMVVACCVASIALSCCAALSSSRRASWLLRVARLYRPIWLHRPLVLLSCRLVVSSPLSPYHVMQPSRPLVAPAGCCVSHVSIALSGCTVLLSSCRAGWLLLVASPLSSYHLAPPSRPLVVPADCCMSSCRPIWFLVEFDCTIVNCKSMTPTELSPSRGLDCEAKLCT